MTRARLWGYFAGTAAVAALFGFLFGWYQAFPAQHSRDRAMLRLRLSEARSRTLDTRIALLGRNYGDARQHTQEAIRLLDMFKASGQRLLPEYRIGQGRSGTATPQGHARPGAERTVQRPPPAQRAEDQAEARALNAANLLGEVYRATPEP